MEKPFWETGINPIIGFKDHLLRCTKLQKERQREKYAREKELKNV